jgi:hypothetical protein
MAEYRPLMFHSRTEHDDDDELELLKADGKVSHHSNISHAENHTALVWYSDGGHGDVSGCRITHQCFIGNVSTSIYAQSE